MSKTADGDIEIALVVESEPDGKQSLVIRRGDVPVLIEMLRRQMGDDDPEDLSTMRNLRPVI